MKNLIKEFINSQTPDRRPVFENMHKAILANDSTVTPAIEKMMGKEMILYKAQGTMKYGLAAGKQYMSLHLMPMYCDQKRYDQFLKLLPHASFQKGCINFTSEDQMPVKTLGQIIKDCEPFDFLKVREEQLKAKKAAKKK